VRQGAPGALTPRAGKRFIGCSGYPECKRTYPLPQFGTLEFLGEACPECGAPVLRVKGRGGWRFCANMECPTSKKAGSGQGAKAKGEGKKPPAKRSTPKRPVKKADEDVGTEGAGKKASGKAKGPAVKKAAKTVVSPSE